MVCTVGRVLASNLEAQRALQNDGDDIGDEGSHRGIVICVNRSREVGLQECQPQRQISMHDENDIDRPDLLPQSFWLRSILFSRRKCGILMRNRY